MYGWKSPIERRALAEGSKANLEELEERVERLEKKNQRIASILTDLMEASLKEQTDDN